MRANHRHPAKPRNDYLTIHHFSLKYAILRASVEPFFLNYYRKVEVQNRQVVKYDQPIILAPNHQNALMDALAILFSDKGQPVFLARADIFRKPAMAKILHFLNIMPVYRIRDGMDSLGQNDEIFQATLNILRDNHRLCLMPEGNHGDKHRLRPLVKGIFRIAFLAQQDYGEKPGIKIIPVGIDYSEYEKFQQTLFVNYGTPIEVSEYFSLWQGNPAQGINALKDRLADEISNLMIDIRPEEYYNCYQELRTIYRPYMLKKLGMPTGTLSAAFHADKEMIRCLDRYLEDERPGMEKLSQQVADYTASVKSLGLRDWLFSQRQTSFPGLLATGISLLAGLPLFLYGWLHHALPYFIPVALAKKIKDSQFRSSVKMVVGMLITWILYLLFFLVSLCFLPLWGSLLYLASLPVAGLFAFRYFIWVRKFMARLRYRRLTVRKDKAVSALQDLRQAIMGTMEAIVSKYVHS